MLVYSIVMFAAAAACVLLGSAIAKGNANLINGYRSERVTDKAVYCRKMGRAMLLLGAVLLLSGVIGLFGETFAMIAVGELLVGETLGIVYLFSVQKKYGGGIF